MINKLMFFLLMISSFAFGQKTSIINNESTLYSLKTKKDTIDFIVVNTNLKEKKPVLIYFQGSQSRPLYIKFDDGNLGIFGSGIDMMDLKTIAKYYNLVVISMPKTPVVVDEKNLSTGYWYDPNHDNIPENDFNNADFLENYVERGNAVIDFLKKQNWVDKTKISIFGHSQGTKVAARIASQRKDLFAVGLLSPNPFGRIDQYIREARKEAENGKVSWKDAEKDIQEQYDFYKEAVNDKSGNPNLKSWKSFSQPQINDWLKINSPLYVAYGTNDIVADLCDLMPLEFIRAKKNNLTLKRYHNTEHSFFEVEKDGTVNHEKPHFKKVINDFVNWTFTK
ncbi:prolyl oligopeptidase family serine peptidase [Kaistella sp.]|uniref:prolyl oligopeptidase family serine peptidase n=1 Tax=Kaistella sp. TaxID=2782235 RepID=UPI003C35EECC